MSRLHHLCALTLATTAAHAAHAQSHVIASVPVSQATTTGSLSVSGSRNLLGDSSIITALDRPAHVTLFRGGDLLLCQTSMTHLTGGRNTQQLAGKLDPLLIALDRGSLELQMPFTRDDALITPDLRFTSADPHDKPAQLSLALRVTPNGDTCVENRGKKSPNLTITDAFGQSSYLLKGGQHVLFEHGSLKEVVDTESSPCGCPPPQSVSLADAAVRGGTFPAAVSQGLATPTPIPQDKPGDTQVQVSATLTYDPANPAADAPAPPTGDLLQPPMLAHRQTAPDAPPKKDPVHAIGRFFKKLFVR